ncbi:MAG: PorT family protein, partial [Tannerella sp.]|nr:PorT family protein [Tannerella sp.]
MKNKKWLWPVLTVLMISATSTANAQFRFGIKGGLNVATVKFNENVIAAENLTGFHIGPVFEFMPGGVGVDFGVLFTQKGFYSEG